MAKEQMVRVAATVVTYNRLEFLKDLIHCLRLQTRKPDEIIVVNNSSTDGTLEWLAEQDDLTVITQANTGSSGGQYTGFRTAYEQGYDWIWTMDDDVAPEANCLELLLENFDEGTIRAPLRYTKENKPFFNDAIKYDLEHPFHSFWDGVLSEKDLEEKYIKADGITFEGPLIHRSIIERIGFPEKNFFIFADDTEYFIRAVKAGAKIIVVRDARFNRKLTADPHPKEFTWKHYYIIRNIIAVNVLHGNFLVRYIRPFGFLIRWLEKCNNINDYKTTIKAFFDGYFYTSKN